MTTRSAADVLGIARPISALQRASLSVTLASDNLAAATNARALFFLAKTLTQTSVRVPQSKSGVSKKKTSTASEYDSLVVIV